jgi:hypothetical protein
MPFDSIIWDLDDDPDGNVKRCAEGTVYPVTAYDVPKRQGP